jgi:glycerol-3-phosphate acyltransferase PlsY
MLGLELWLTGLGYLLGSLPTGYLVGRHYGIDIRNHGSGNIGATNVARVLGRKRGLFVFLCDCLKGWIAVRLAYTLVWDYAVPVDGLASGLRARASFVDFITMVPAHDVLAGVLAGIACILGHNFPVWLGFRGGKGIATTTGVLLALMPAAVAVSAVVWGAAFFVWRYVSLASLLAAATLPITVGLLWWSGRADEILFWFSVAAAALAFWRHRTNIQRLLSKTEPRFTGKPAAR